MPKRPKTRSTAESDAASATLRAQAREAGPGALHALQCLAHGADSESVQLAAIKELLDRGFGRAAPGDQEGGVIAHLVIDDGYAR